MALANLVDVANVIGTAATSALQSEQLGMQVMASLGSFDTGWKEMSLAIFGLHLVGLGYLLFNRWTSIPRSAGGRSRRGVSRRFLHTNPPTDLDITFSLFTFVGEALLIFWLLANAIRGFASEVDRGIDQATAV